MACLGAKTYDPGSITTKATSALLAMTAIDTTNLRITFTTPASGPSSTQVLVRMRCIVKGATTSPQIILGVLGNLAGGSGTNVLARQVPIASKLLSTANNMLTYEACFLITGLTANTSYSFDAAYGVEFAVASSNINYGGPNNGTANDAAGAFAFEVWEVANLMIGKLYDPGTKVSKSVGTAIAQTAFDTTNLRLTFTTAPAGSAGSTQVLVKIRCAQTGGTVCGSHLFGVLGNIAGGSGTDVLGRAAPIGGASDIGTPAATTFVVWEAIFVITGLTANTSYSFDASYGVELVAASGNIVYGGPNDTTQANAGGGFAFEVWAA